MPLLLIALQCVQRDAEGAATAHSFQRALRNGPADGALVDAKPRRSFDGGQTVSAGYVVIA
ncbi:MAG: hypothetical protein R2853_04700 [Thermomicrobiales bacterium]